MQWNNWWNVTHTNVAYSYTVFLLQILCNLLNFRSNLAWCLHPLMNSFLLFNNPLSLKCSMRCPFSGKHSGQKLMFVLPYTFSAIVYLAIDIVWSSFNDYTYFGNSVLFSIVKIYVAISNPCFERCFCKIKLYFVSFICIVFNISSVY